MESRKSSPIRTRKEVLYTARVVTTCGREGASRSSDGRLDVKYSRPESGGIGTNPEQLFAACWSASFEGAMAIIARKMKITIPEELAIEAEVDLCSSDKGFFLQARLNISLPDLDHKVALTLVNAAHLNCPYSKAVKGNVGVEINLV
ncbi:Ohr family peroxiredoxin [Telmatocola sphagniphila]